MNYLQFLLHYIFFLSIYIYSLYLYKNQINKRKFYIEYNFALNIKNRKIKIFEYFQDTYILEITSIRNTIPGSFSNQRELWSEDGSRKRASSDSRKCTRGFIDKSMEAGVAARLFCIKCNGVCMQRGAIAFIVATHASGPDDGFCSVRRCASPALSTATLLSTIKSRFRR